jgi:hypothetical protein
MYFYRGPTVDDARGDTSLDLRGPASSIISSDISFRSGFRERLPL